MYEWTHLNSMLIIKIYSTVTVIGTNDIKLNDLCATIEQQPNSSENHVRLCHVNSFIVKYAGLLVCTNINNIVCWMYQHTNQGE